MIERFLDGMERASGLCLAGPAVLDGKDWQPQATPWTLVAEEYGDFLITIYEEWVGKGDHRVAWTRPPCFKHNGRDKRAAGY